MNASSQIQKPLCQWPSGRKRLKRISCELRANPNTRRLKHKLVGLKSRRSENVGKRSRSFFPGRRLPWPLRCIPLHDHFATRLHHQFLVRLLNGEEAKKVSEVVHAFSARPRGWMDM